MNKFSHVAAVAVGLAVAGWVWLHESRDSAALLLGLALAVSLAITLSLAASVAGQRQRRRADQHGDLEAQVAERTRQLQASLAELRGAKLAAEKSSGEKSEFLARMSREIRTPMNGVLGMTEMLRLSSLNPRQRQIADVIHRSASSLVEVIDDILDFSKIQKQALELASIPFDPRAAVEDAAELLAADAQAKGLELVLALRSSIPSSVIGDPGRLRQVISNLVSNAIKFTERGEIVVRGASKPVGTDQVLLEFSVRDTGPGIAASLLPTLFGPAGNAADQPREGSSGLGLGLAIVKQLVALMGGEISVDSQPGRGTTFTFSLRLQADPEARAALLPAHLSGLRVLIVDDNRVARESLAERLKEHGIDAEVAGGAKRGIEILQGAADREPIPIAIIEERMQGGSGAAFIAQMKDSARIAGTRIVLLTEIAPQAGVVPEALPPGVDALLAKPLRTTQMLGALGRLASRSGATAVQPAEESASAPAPEAPRALALAVMLVDDNPIDRQVATAMLESVGCVVITADDGEEALEVLTPDSVDVVLMDCLMPSMDGYSAVREIRRREAAQRSPRVPIIALTASHEEEDRRKCLEAGMDAVLGKPIARADLVATLRSFAERVDAPPVPGATPRQAPGEALARDVLAENTVSQITNLGGAELLPALVQSYQRESIAAISALRVAARSADSRALVESFRFLEATSAALGGERLAFACRQAEASARRGDAGGLVPMIDRIVAEHREFMRALVRRIRVAADPPLGATG